MLIKTERLQIRWIRESDWESVRDIWEDFNRSEYAKYDMPHNTDGADVRARMAKWEKACTGRKHMFFAVCHRNAVIGYIAANIRENGYEIGYCFHSRYSRQGYAKESHLAVFSYLHSLGITRLTAGTALLNLPSAALLQSLGFRKIREEKVSFYRDKNGQDLFFDGGIFEKLL